MRRIRETTLIRFALVAALLISLIGSQTPSRAAADALDAADALFSQEKWRQAADAYKAVTRKDDANGRAWLGLGLSLHRLQRFDPAIAALEKADASGFAPPRARYNLARANARAGRIDAAFSWLDKALDAGFPAFRKLRNEPDLESLYGDPRFEASVARAERNAFPCRDSEAHRQFDFWVGDWEVRTPQGQMAGTNSIRSSAAGCLLLESWKSNSGGTGQSINYYDPNTHQWHQTWVDSGGEVIYGQGGLRDGAMHLIGTHVLKDGETRPFRMTVTPLTNGHVRQFLEESLDDGKSWSVWFDGDYAPKP